MIKLINKNIYEGYDSKARYEIADNIASWAFGSFNMNDIDDNIDFLINRWLKYTGEDYKQRLYMCDTVEDLANVLSECSLKLLMSIERGLCIDEDSVKCETDYISNAYDESYKKLHEQVDISIYSKIKNKALSFIQDTDKKTAKLVSNSEHYSLDDVLEIYDRLVKDKDIKQALIDNDFIGKLNISSNRYAQALPILTMYKVRSKTGKSGWSKWTVTSESLRLREQDVEIEVKHEGILEVPEGKNVDDLPFSHFEKLVKKKGLSKITKALNNLQVWNKNDDKKLSKWAGDMIDKLNKKLKKDESWYERIPAGYKWRNIVIPSDDDFEAEIEEYIADLKLTDDKIEWDIDYHGGMFGDDRTISLYSSGEDYTDVKYKVENLRDKALYDEGCNGRKKKKKLKKEDSYGYVHDEDEAKLSPAFQSYLRKRGWLNINIDGKKYYQMDFNYGNMFCDIYIDEWGNCYLVTDNDDLRLSDMFYTITETNTNVIDDLITLGNTIASTGDIDSALSVFFS